MRPRNRHVAACPEQLERELAPASASEQAAAQLGTGIGLRAPHVQGVLAGDAVGRWLEVHAENYMSDGADAKVLAMLRERHAIALHGVGLSLGSAEPLNRAHAERLRSVVERVEPIFVSEHLAFSSIGGIYTNTLAPLPYDDETLHLVTAKVDQLQTFLGRQVLIENPASYLQFCDSVYAEPQFLEALAGRTGCGLLCDLTNVFVSAANLDFDAIEYLGALPGAAIKEIHLAGHSSKQLSDAVILLDDHGSAVADPIWSLWAEAVRMWGPIPALIEWDTALPSLSTLLAEAARADHTALLSSSGEQCQT